MVMDKQQILEVELKFYHDIHLYIPLVVIFLCIPGMSFSWGRGMFLLTDLHEHHSCALIALIGFTDILAWICSKNLEASLAQH